MTQKDTILKGPHKPGEATLAKISRLWVGKVLWRWAIPALAFLGAMVSSYLTYVHWARTAALCVGFGDCEVVNQSVYSEVVGVPVALLGLAMYAAILGGSLWSATSPPEAPLRPFIALVIFGISLMGVLYSAYLTYVELFILRAICPWCVVSAVLVSFIFVLSARDLTLVDISPSN